MILHPRHSFRLVSRKQILASRANVVSSNSKLNLEAEAQVQNREIEEINDKKRAFLKLAGVVGAGVIGTSLIPTKAHALVFGSTPGANSLGVKNASNQKINPATEETLSGIKSRTDLLSFDSGTNPANLKVTIGSGSIGVKNASSVAVNPATEDTLALIKAKTDLLSFTGDSLKTSVGGTGNIVGVKDTAGVQINPATDESLIYLRRMVKLMESQATTDAANRQRIVVDGFGAVVTGVGASGAGVPRVTVANDSNFNTTITSLNGWGDGMFQDVARNTYANGIRYNLNFS